MGKSKLLPLFAVLALLAACEEDYTPAPAEPMLYVQYLPCPSDTSMIRVAYARPITSTSGSYKEPGASSVKVKVNGTAATILSEGIKRDGDIYDIPVLASIKAGDEIQVDVDCGGQTAAVSGSTTVPKAPEIAGVAIERTVSDTSGVHYVTLRLSNEVKDGEYYGLKVKSRQSVYMLKRDEDTFYRLDSLVQENYIKLGTYSIGGMEIGGDMGFGKYNSVGYARGGFASGDLYTSDFLDFEPMVLLESSLFDGDRLTVPLGALTIGIIQEFEDWFNAFDDDYDYEPGWEIIEPEEPDDNGEQEDGGMSLEELAGLLGPELTELIGEENLQRLLDLLDFIDNLPDTIVLSYSTQYKFELYRLTGECYNFCKALCLSSFDILSIFGLTPPNFTYSNVAGGMGAVAALSGCETDWFTDPNTMDASSLLENFLSQDLGEEESAD